MSRIKYRLCCLMTALTVCIAVLPIFSVNADAAELGTRDPFYGHSNNYNYYESEHFQFIWGNSGESVRVTEDFLNGNAHNLENCWSVYMNELQMAPPTQSTNISMRDGNEYKTNVYISGTGLEGMQDDWAYMSYDKDGFAYMFCCVDSMQYDPPSWVLPHKFGHEQSAFKNLYCKFILKNRKVIR